MVLPVNDQLNYFLTAIAGGFFIGIMFDIYRIIRGFDTPGKLITIISDLLFWVLTGILIFLFFLYTNNAYLRYSTFVGLGLGLYIYFAVISRLFLNILKWIVYYIIKLFRVLFILIIYPIKLIRYFLKLVLYKGKSAIAAGYGKSKSVFKKIRFGYNLKKEKSKE